MMQNRQAPLDDDAQWARWLRQQPFYIAGLPFDDYAPAVRLARVHFREDTLVDDVIGRLGSEWEEAKGRSRLAWLEARDAVRAVWLRCGSLRRTPEVREAREPRATRDRRAMPEGAAA
jgi:hypothetical protein